MRDEHRSEYDAQQQDDQNSSPLDSVIEQPLNSTVLVERRADGITLTVPEKGLLKGSFSAFPIGIILIVSVLVVFSISISQSISKREFQHLPMTCLFAFMAGSVGFVITLFGYHLGKLRTVVAVSYGSLLVSIQSPLSKTTRQWEKDAIETIHVTESGIEINKRPLMQLELELKDGTEYGCLRHLSEPELDWAAYEIRKALAESSI